MAIKAGNKRKQDWCFLACTGVSVVLLFFFWTDEARRAKYISRILKLPEHFYFYILHFSYTCVEFGKDMLSYFASNSSYFFLSL